MSVKLFLKGDGSEESNTFYTFIDEQDADLDKYVWSYNLKLGYVYRMKDKKTLFLHRKIAKRMLDDEEWYDGDELKTVDHINRDKLDNRKENLRTVTRTQNQLNKGRQKNNISGYEGVTWDKRKEKWVSRISVNRKQIFLGQFTSLQGAWLARRWG